MAEQQGSWPAAAHPPPGWLPERPSAPVGPPPRPVYREPHRLTVAPLLAGVGATVVWFALFGGLGRDLAGYAWWTLTAAISAWAVAIVLALLGDRGAATGVAVVTGVGLSTAAGFVTARWISTNDWPLW